MFLNFFVFLSSKNSLYILDISLDQTYDLQIYFLPFWGLCVLRQHWFISATCTALYFDLCVHYSVLATKV